MKNQEAVLCNKKDVVPNPHGMIFVRISDILIRMVKAPILAIAILLTVVLPTQSFGSLRSVEFTIYPDGTTHVSQQAIADPTEPELKVNLFGKSFDNFIAQDENGLLLSFEIEGKVASVQTFGASSVSIEYDNYDLISKKGKIWTFTIDSPVDYSVTMPDEATIVDISNPDNIDTIDNKHVSLLKGKNQIEYFFNTSGPALSAFNTINQVKSLLDEANSKKIDVSSIQEKLEMAVSAYDNKKYTDAENLAHEARTLAEQKIAEAEVNNQNSNTIDWFKNNIVGIATSIVAIGGAVSAITLLLKKTKSVVKKTMGPLLSKEETETESISESEIDEPITLEMRDDDKQLVSYLEKNGGQAFERDLRKKFLLPRTTMWRAVKRLERQGVIEIQKKDFQNLVRLKTKGDSQ